MTLTGFIAYAGALAIAAAIPGPGVTALIARALGSGFRPAFAMSVGLILGDLTYLTAVVLGLAFLAQTFGVIFMVVKWLGVVYLAWLAWKFWSTGITPEDIAAKKGSTGLVSNFIGGLALTIGNPKTMIFYVAITPTVIDLHAITLADYGILAVVTVLVLMVVLVPYLAPAKARGLLKSPRGLKYLSRGAATFMAGAAAAMPRAANHERKSNPKEPRRRNRISPLLPFQDDAHSDFLCLRPIFARKPNYCFS
jgi:threonine/homoserine/homoserine lactone efflux protein